MDALLAGLDRLGLRLRARGALARASRRAFVAAVAACLLLLAARFFSRPLPAAGLAAALGAVAFSFLAFEFLRPYGRPRAAAELDRLLDLEERLSTALEASGPLGGLQAADAFAALSAARLPAAPFPLEAKLFAASFVVLLGLAAVPSFEKRDAAAEARVRALLEDQAARLREAAPDSVEVREAAAELPLLTPERAMARLDALRARMAEKMLRGGPGGDEARRALDAAGAAADGLGAELGLQGRTIHASAPGVAEAKLRRRLEAPSLPPSAQDLPPTVAAAVLSRKDWDPVYDPVVERYFRGMP